MDLRVKKGTSLSEVYYTFLFLENENEFETLIEYYLQNSWWFSKFHPEARIQCEMKFNSAKIKSGVKNTNIKAEKFFKSDYE
ncbi:MAG: hypothetical protein ACRCZ2_05160 [Fusobacteriaceae bacterium]